MLSAIAPLLSPDAAVDALKLAAELPSAQARSDALVSLVPALDGGAALAALKVVDSVTAPRARAVMLRALAPVLPEPRLTRALMLALEIRDQQARGVALARLEPRLTARHRAIPRYRRRAVSVDDEAVLQGWDATQGRASEDAAPPVSSTGRTTTPLPTSSPEHADGEAALPEAVEWDAESAPRQLAEVVHAALGGALLDWFRSRLRDDTVDIDAVTASASASASATATATAATPPPVPVRKQPGTLRTRLRQAIRDRRVDLSDPEIVAALDTVEAVERRTAMHLGLRLAEVRDSDDDGAPGGPDLAAVIPVFAAHGRLGEALDAARELTGPYRRCEALAAAVPYVPDVDRSAIAAQAWGDLLAAVRASSPRMWLLEMHVVRDLLPLVDGAAAGRLARVLRTVAARPGAEMPPPDVLRGVAVQVQLRLLLRAGKDTAGARAADGLRTAAQVRSEAVRAAALAAFTPVLPRSAVRTAIPLARRLRAVHRRAERLAALAARAHAVGSGRLAADIVVQIAGLPDAGASPQILALVARNAALVPAGRLAELWCPSVGEGLVLRHPANGSRDALCPTVAAFLPALARIGGTAVAAQIETSTETVRRWWP